MMHKISKKPICTKEGKFRSKFEAKVAGELTKSKASFEYEKVKIKYAYNALKTYTPDFVLKKNGIIIETKGRFTVSDRIKHSLLKEQYPKLDVRIVFQNHKQRLSKKSKTTYAQWCDKKGIKWAAKSVPKEWLEEK